jgi:hypothetical protein
LDTGGELSGCCHTSNMRTGQREGKKFVRFFCVGKDWVCVRG